MAKQGLMVQDEKGNLYFLRPEILAAAKLPKSLHKEAAAALKASKKTKDAPKLKTVGAIRLVNTKVEVEGPVDGWPIPGNVTPTPKMLAMAGQGAGVNARMLRIKTTRPSTIMCPW